MEPYLPLVRDAHRLVEYGGDGRFAAALGRPADWIRLDDPLACDYDAIVLFDAIAELAPADLRELLTRVHQALARGGIVLVRSTASPHALDAIHGLARSLGFQIAAAGAEGDDAWYLVARRDPASGGVPRNDGSIVWEGEFFTAFSLAVVNRELVRAVLASSTLDLRLLSTEVSDHLDVADRARFATLADRFVRAPDGADVWIRHPWPPYFIRPPARTYVHMQMWEFGALPADWVAAGSTIDEVWCPSSYVASLYLAAGFDPARVAIVPLGVDTTIFTPVGPTIALPSQKTFRFCYVGGTIERKGIDVLLSAYTQAFTAADDVTLIIKDFGASDIYAGLSYRALIERITQTPGMPEILYIDATLTGEQLAALYRSAHAYVHPYRGEGFALPVLEAMACGLAPIATRGGATDDYLDDTTGYPIPAVRRSIGRHAHGHDLIADGWLLEPDVAALVQAMRRIVSEPNERSEKARAAANRAAQWSWQRSGERVRERIDALCKK